jgi:predicted O-linked N-acetylglucosamine transferase (SPINDLY family)
MQQLVMLLNAGQFQQLEAQARGLVAEHPQFGHGWKILALAIHHQGGNALAEFGRAAQLLPKDHESHVNLANALMELGQPEDAVRSYRRALKLRPDDAQAHCGLGNALMATGKLDEALLCHQRALRLEPDSFLANFNLANILRNLGRLAEAEAGYRRAAALAPEFAEAHYNLGNVLQDLGQLDASADSFRRALSIRADYLDAHNNLGHVLRELGQLDAAIASFRRALEIQPDYLDARSNLLFASVLLANQSPADALAAAREFGARVANQVCPYTSWRNDADPGRCLRVGFVSGDLRSHSVGYFVQGVLASLAAEAAGRLELHAYYNNARSDAVSAQIKASCRGWHPVRSLSDPALAEKIRADGIDILIDLSGHTALNRLPLFALKPAPVQVSWLGYLATTGLAAMDYVIADRWTLPPSEDACFTEKIWRLPETYLCFTAPEEDVGVGALPARANGHVTFGCFNNLNKLNDAVIALWARVLAGVPSSRLLLKTRQLGDAAVRQSICERFAACGIDPARLILEGFAPSRAGHLGAYQRVDIALDPFPYPGITTSVEGLWMGVPLLTMAGERFLSRQGVGLLMNAGLPQWIAADADDYAAKAVAHAADLESLSVLRASLRQKVLGSPLFDTPRFARQFEAALRGMWRERCDLAGLGAQA